MVVFAVTLAIIFYVVTDVEYPRFGLIWVEGFDHFLIDLRANAVIPRRWRGHASCGESLRPERIRRAERI